MDAVFRIESPDGEAGEMAVMAKGTFEARDVAVLTKRITDSADGFLAPATPMVIARYLNVRVRDRLEAEELAYADATGNLYLKLSKPALFLRDVGADRDPWRGPGRPRGSLKGPKAARVVRALVDFEPPMTVPELVQLSQVSTGVGYRVIEFLEREDLIERGERGPIRRVEWRAILERWAEDRELNLEAGAVRFLAPRGIEPLLKSLRSTRESYVLTGSAAAAFFEAYAQTRMALIYAVEPLELADKLDLRPVETGANVLLLPSDYVASIRSTNLDGLQIAAPSQIVADLLNGPGRAPAEASALLDWMARNESAWRRQR